jgi:hypothetical protein
VRICEPRETLTNSHDWGRPEFIFIRETHDFGTEGSANDPNAHIFQPSPEEKREPDNVTQIS